MRDRRAVPVGDGGRRRGDELRGHGRRGTPSRVRASSARWPPSSPASACDHRGARSTSGSWPGCERQLRAIPGMKVRTDPYTIDRWQPLPSGARAAGARPRARRRAHGRIRRARRSPCRWSGAVPFTLPTVGRTAASGELVYLPDGQDDHGRERPGQDRRPRGAGPVDALLRVPRDRALRHAGLPEDRRLRAPVRAPARPDARSTPARRARPGSCFLWDAPTAQLRGYWDPHTGTRFHVPAVYAGSDQAAAIKRYAAQHRTAHVSSCAAKWDTAPTRNIIATLPGQTPRTHRGELAHRRRHVGAGERTGRRARAGAVPREACRARVGTATSSSRSPATTSGSPTTARSATPSSSTRTSTRAPSRSSCRWSTSAPARSCPPGPVTGSGSPAAASRSCGRHRRRVRRSSQASIDAVKRRHLDHTAVVKGTEAPVADRVPAVLRGGRPRRQLQRAPAADVVGHHRPVVVVGAVVRCAGRRLRPHAPRGPRR